VTQPRIVVLGAAGMLGHKIFQALRERYPGTIATAREDLSASPFDRVSLFRGGDVHSGVDVTDFETLRKLLAEFQPDYTVNCVGIIKQREEAMAAIPSITINALLPHVLCEWARQWGGRVIHFSTDCVFSGKRGNYSEEDSSDAEDLYGKSKYLGEISCENGLTLRTSIIGRELVEHRSLLDWFLGQRGKTIKGFRKVIYSGVTTNYLAHLVGVLIANHPALSGLYQVASVPISKYDLLMQLNDAYQAGVTIVPDEAEISDRSMRGNKFVRATGIVTPAWPELVGGLAGDQTPYDAWAKG
jgi:dTDP-4-dehydrorhamnose reductase